MNKALIFIIILLLCGIGHLATDIYLPSMPNMVDYFATTPAWVQFTFTVYMFSFCAIPLLAGPLSDKIGRKKPILFGLILSLIATILCTFANNIYFLIVARLIQGIGLGIVVCMGRALMPDFFKGKDLARYYSYMSSGMPLLLALGPSLGGVIQEYGSWRWVFATMLLYTLLIIIPTIRLLTAHSLHMVKTSQQNPAYSPAGGSAQSYWENYRDLLTNKKYMIFTGSIILMYIGLASYLSVYSFIFQERFGLSPSSSGFLALFFCFFVSMFGVINARLIQKIDPKKILFCAALSIITSAVLILFFNALEVESMFLFALAIIFFFVSVPITFSNGTALALQNVKGNFGAATALMTCLQFLGAGIGSGIMSLTNSTSTLPLAIMFILVGMGCLYMLYLDKKSVVEEIARSAAL